MPSFDDILVCPITQELFDFPVLISSGQTYTKTSIDSWLENNNTDPCSRVQINDKQYIPNQFLENILRKSKQKTPFTYQDFTCPLTRKLIKEPVTTVDGYTYEKTALEQYFQLNGDIEPTTRNPLKLIEGQKFVKNMCAKSCIDKYREEKGNAEEKIFEELDQAIKLGNIKKITEYNPADVHTFLLAQPSENQEKLLLDFLTVAIEEMKPKLLAELTPTLIAFDCFKNILFNQLVEKITAINAAHFHPALSPLKKLGFTYPLLSQNLEILAENLEKQENFRNDLLQNWEHGKNYSNEAILFSIDSIDPLGNTLLHSAVEKDNVPLISWLIDNAASTQLKNKAGKTPLELAIENDKINIVNHLIEQGVPLPEDMSQLPDNAAKQRVVNIQQRIAGDDDFIVKLFDFLEHYIPSVLKRLNEFNFFSTIVPAAQVKKIQEKQTLITQNQTKKNSTLYGIMLKNCERLELDNSNSRNLFLNMPPTFSIENDHHTNTEQTSNTL